MEMWRTYVPNQKKDSRSTLKSIIEEMKERLRG